MEEEKAAAYYNELTRKGERAARFKQGLDFSSLAPNDDVAKPSSSFLSKFVKASSESKKQAQLQSIHNQRSRKSLLSSLGFRAGKGTAIEVEDEVGAEKNVGKGAEAVIDTGKHEDEAGVERDIGIVKEGDEKLGYFP